MTVIIGIKHGGDVWLGADSFLGNNEVKQECAQPKIFRHHVPGGGPMVMGISGSLRAGFLIRSMALPEHQPGTDAHSYVAEFLVSAIRERYSGAGFLETENGREKDGNSQIIIGYQRRLFEIYYDFDVYEYMDNYAAIGAGQYIALGALHSLTEFAYGSPVEKLRAALAACAHHSPWVKRPFTIMKVEEVQDATH